MEYKINSEAKFYQMISRNNDVNGNPYRLVILYNDQGLPIQCFEARSSSPDVEFQLYGQRYPQIMSIHVTPKEYNRIKRYMSNYSTVTNGIERSY